jgi:hypothetical protein
MVQSPLRHREETVAVDWAGCWSAGCGDLLGVGDREPNCIAEEWRYRRNGLRKFGGRRFGVPGIVSMCEHDHLSLPTGDRGRAARILDP